MKEVALDTETTGLEVAHNHRIIEIGCVELVSGRRSGKVFHAYINPSRAVSPEAVKVHGLENDFLRHQPPFSKVAEDFLSFIKDARLIIHNAEFDLGFLNMELRAIKKPSLKNEVIDTLALAREKFPNQSNRLDALCQRFGIDISQRSKHGALLDAGLLAEVYIALSAGEQASLTLAPDPPQTPPPPPPPLPASERVPPQAASAAQILPSVPPNAAKQPQTQRLTPEEIKAHQDFIKQTLGKNAIWPALCDIKKDVKRKNVEKI